MSRPRALQVWLGPRAAAWVRERGLAPQDIRVIPGAAGGPKGLMLNPLDRHLFGRWFSGSRHTLHLLGASIGAWRMASACLPDPDAALARLAEDYITQDYPKEPGAKRPSAATVSRMFADGLAAHFGAPGATQAVLGHPQRRLHIVTAHGRARLLRREGRWRTAFGYAAAYGANALSRRALGGWIERVLFSDPRERLPLPTDDLAGTTVALTAENLRPALLASCSIPFWLQAVHDIPGAPAGAYWDGGITDYHLHWHYAGMTEGLVLYPHFQPALVPGWLDKAHRRRHAATPWLDNLILLHPNPAWVATLPGAKLPDRQDFKIHMNTPAERMRRWRQAVAEAQRFADEAAEWLQRPQLPG